MDVQCGAGIVKMNEYGGITSAKIEINLQK